LPCPCLNPVRIRRLDLFDTGQDGQTPPVEHDLFWERDFKMKVLDLLKVFQTADSGAAAVGLVALKRALVNVGMVIMVAVGGGITGLGDAVITDRTAGTGADWPGCENL
jgi:hypothetical protein